MTHPPLSSTAATPPRGTPAEPGFGRISCAPDGAASAAATLFAALGAVAAAEALAHGVAPGFGVALCLSLIAAAMFALRARRLARRPGLGLVAAVAAAVLALAEEVAPLSVALVVAALALAAASLGGRRFGDLLNRLICALGLVARAPLALARRLRGGLARVADLRRLSRDWAAPLALGAAFALLFANANPMLARFLDLRWPAPDEIVGRLAFWALWAGLAAALVATRAPALRLRNVAPGGALVAAALGEGAVLRGLILFNAIFAVETATDALFLWAGAALPHGMTYAEYAHRGAWPLMLAALLAGAFALAAMRPDAASPRAFAIRALTLLFLAQTLALLASAALRLDLYVSVYGLTPWRVAAFLWMGLVATGLVLIVAAMATGRSRRWLASANAAAALATLLIGAALDPAVIADHNLRHAREMGGAGVAADVELLAALGPSALPAIEALLPRLDALGRVAEARRLSARRDALRDAHRARMADWRSRSLRALRLQARLDATASASPLR